MLNKSVQINFSDPSLQNLIPADARKLFLTSADFSQKISSLNLILIRNSFNGLPGCNEDIQFSKEW